MFLPDEVDLGNDLKAYLDFENEVVRLSMGEEDIILTSLTLDRLNEALKKNDQVNTTYDLGEGVQLVRMMVGYTLRSKNVALRMFDYQFQKLAKEAFNVKT